MHILYTKRQQSINEKKMVQPSKVQPYCPITGTSYTISRERWQPRLVFSNDQVLLDKRKEYSVVMTCVNRGKLMRRDFPSSHAHMR